MGGRKNSAKEQLFLAKKNANFSPFSVKGFFSAKDFREGFFGKKIFRQGVGEGGVYHLSGKKSTK